MSMEYFNRLQDRWGPVVADIHQVKEVDEHRVGMEDGWSMPRANFPEDTEPGDVFIVQTVKGSTPVTVARVTFFKTAEELDDDHKAFVAKMDADHEARLAEHREEWAEREAALPEPLRDRLDNFREKAGTEQFNLKGWGYELVVSELAVLYSHIFPEKQDWEAEDSEEILAYARKEGTSGNQHEFARVLARELAKGHDDVVAGAISALTPLGVGAYWEKA